MHLFRHCFFVGVLFAGIPATAQDTTKEINFLSLPHAQLKSTFDYKKKVVVKVINVNRFLYKLSSEKTETDFNVQPPAILSGIKLPGAMTLGSAFAGPPAPGSSALVQPVTLENEVQKLVDIQKHLDSAVDLHNAIAHLTKSCTEPFQNIKDQTETKLATFIRGARSAIPQMTATLESDLESRLNSAGAIFEKIEKLKDTLKQQNQNKFRDDQRDVKDNLAIYRTELAGLQAKLKNQHNPKLRARVENAIKNKEAFIRGEEAKLETNVEDRTANDKNLDQLFEKAKTLYGEMKKFRDEGKHFTIVEDIRKVNESNFSYYTEVVKMKKDEVKFDVTANSEAPLPCDRPNEQKFAVTLRTKGGIKLDFSTGVFFNFGNSEFLGQQFYYKPVTDSLSTIALVEAGKSVGLGIGALMHIYMRSPAGVKIGGAVGVSSTTGFDALNFHLGLSLILGDKERFCITPGLVLREVDVLDNRYSIGSSYATALLPEAVPTTKRFPKSGFFISLTYNISRFNK